MMMIIYIYELNYQMKLMTEQFYNPAKIYINIDADNNPSTGYFTNGIGSEYGINFLINLFLTIQITPQLIHYLYMI